jgi:hypothetical protein
MGTHTKENVPRTLLMQQLKPLLPDEWRLIKYEDNSDEPDRLTVKVRQRGVARLKEAPQGFYTTQFVLELITPETDPAKAEDSLDVALFVFLDILDTINPTLWQSTQKILDALVKRLAYDVTINLVTKKD